MARCEEVRRLRAEGLSLRAIADQMGLNRQTVQRFANAETFPERQGHVPYPNIADPYETGCPLSFDTVGKVGGTGSGVLSIAGFVACGRTPDMPARR